MAVVVAVAVAVVAVMEIPWLPHLISILLDSWTSNGTVAVVVAVLEDDNGDSGSGERAVSKPFKEEFTQA